MTSALSFKPAVPVTGSSPTTDDVVTTERTEATNGAHTRWSIRGRWTVRQGGSRDGRQRQPDADEHRYEPGE